MIDQQAYIHPDAKIAEDVAIGPWTYIGADVEIGAGTIIEPHVVIKNAKIGKKNHIYQFASIGEAPQHLTFPGKNTRVEIGNDNLIREYVSIHRGTEEADGVTRIGNSNFFMAYSHVAHDCKIGMHNIFANCAQLAGHVVVGDYVFLGGFIGVHQFCQIGSYSFLGRATKIVKDILPYMIVSGNPGYPVTVNSIGLRRNKFSQQDIKAIKDAFKFIVRQKHAKEECIAYLKQKIADFPVLQLMLDAITASKRGVARGDGRHTRDEE